MKIALFVPGGVDRSGEVRVIPALVALIDRIARKHELHVFATHQEPEPGTWELRGARIHNIGEPRRLHRAISLVLAEHRRSPFHVCHSIWAGRSGALAVLSARLLRVPSLVHLAGGELVALDDIAYGGCRTLRGRILNRCVLQFADSVTAASQPICDLGAQFGVRVERVPLGIDPESWPAAEPRPRPPDEAPRLVHVASLNPVKDQLTLMRALATLVDRGTKFTLDIVGEDTLDGRIQSAAWSLGIADKVRFHGFLPQRQLRPIVESAHLLVMSSRHEAGPIVVLEAAAVGVPTVGTAVGHIAEWSPAAALAVPCADSIALGAAIRILIDDDGRRLRLAAEARRRARLTDADCTTRNFCAIYDRLIHSGAVS